MNIFKNPNRTEHQRREFRPISTLRCWDCYTDCWVWTVIGHDRCHSTTIITRKHRHSARRIDALRSAGATDELVEVRWT